MDRRLAGRVALVTGGASGIGAAWTLALARAGADVAIGIHGDQANGDDHRAAVEALGRRAIVVARMSASKWRWRRRSTRSGPRSACRTCWSTRRGST